MTTQRSPGYLNRPFISSPLLGEDDLNSPGPAYSYSPGNTPNVIRRPKSQLKRAQTISQVFDLSPFDTLSSSPMATAVFASTDKTTATKTFLSRQLKNKGSVSSLSSFSLRSPMVVDSPHQTIKSSGQAKLTATFYDFHSCLSAEYAFSLTKPLVQPDRYLLKKGGLKLENSDEQTQIYVFLFNDCFVYGISPSSEIIDKGLLEQQIMHLTEVKLDSSQVNENRLILNYQGVDYSFLASDSEESEKWSMVMQSAITFYCAMSQRKAKQDTLSIGPSRRGSVASVLSMDARVSKRSSFYNTLKDLVGTFI